MQRMGLSILVRLAMPLLLALGGFLTWQRTRAKDERNPDKPDWRDDSLDDWRRERDEAAATARDARAADPARHASTAAEESEPALHQRLGG